MLSFKKSVTILLLIIFVAIFFLLKIHVTNTPATYIPKHLESKILNDQILKEFNNDDTMVFLFHSKEALDKTLLEKLEKFTSSIEEIENVKNVHSIFSYEFIRSIEDGFEISSIIDPEKIQEANLKDVLSKVQEDKFVKDFFVTSDLKVFGVSIEPEYINDSMARLALEKKIFESLENSNLKEGVLAYGGEFSVDTAQYRELDRIMFVVVPITFTVGVLLLYFLFNSIFAVIVGTVFNGIVAAVVLSLFGVFGWPYNMIGSMIPTLMMALCIAFLVHLYNGILLRKENGESHEEAIKKSFEAINKPSLFSALTTSAGLFSLAISDIPPIRSVGIIGGIGMLIIYFMVLHLLPPILIRFDIGEWKQNANFKTVLNSCVTKLVETSMLHYNKVLITFLGGIVSLSFFIFNVQSESNLYKFFQDDHEVNVASREIKKHFMGTTIVNFIFDSQEQSVVSAAFNQKIDFLKEQIVKIPGVGRVFSPTDIIKQLNWAFQGENEKFFAVPSSDELIEQYLLIYDGEDLFDFLSRDQNRFKMTLNLNVEGANKIEEVVNKVEAIIKDQKIEGVKYGVAGYGKMFSDQENLIIEDLFKSVGISFIVIFCLMAVLWKSIPGSMFCMLPNVSPVISMFILMGIFGIWLDMGTAMIASVTVGIAVDDTIHIFQGFMKNRKKHDLETALRLTYNESGRAIIITSIILSAQFLVLAFANFIPLRNFGLLTTVGIVTALVFDLLLLPALIVLREKLSA